MYIAELLNENNLLSHFGSYVNKNRSVNSNEFLLHTTTVIICLKRIAFLNSLCIEQIAKNKEKLDIKDHKIVFWSPIFVELLSIIPTAFASLVIMQNKVFPLLKHPIGFQKEVQSSMRDSMKDIYKYNLPKPIMMRVNNYWTNFGLTVRQYRDIAEHYYKLLANSYYQFKPIEKIVIYLPDDPDQKNSQKYTFEGKIDCVEYIENSFIQLCKFINSVFIELKYPAELISQSVDAGVPVQTEEGIEKTIMLMLTDSQGDFGLEIRQNKNRTMKYIPITPNAEEEK